MATPQLRVPACPAAGADIRREEAGRSLASAEGCRAGGGGLRTGTAMVRSGGEGGTPAQGLGGGRGLPLALSARGG